MKPYISYIPNDWIINTYLPSLDIKMSKTQKYVFKELLAYNYIDIDEFNESKAGQYLKSFQGEKRHYINKRMSCKLDNSDLVMYCQNYHGRNTIISRYDLKRDHVPFFDRKYFGIEMECIISGSECCNYCEGSGQGSLECHVCEGSGENSSSCDECNGVGSIKVLNNRVTEIVDCNNCDNGSVFYECTTCDGNCTIDNECNHCDGSGRNASSAMSALESRIKRLKIPYLSLTEDSSIEPDDDSSECGVEVRLMVTLDTLHHIKTVTEFLKKEFNAYVNESCGLHVHLDTREDNETTFKVKAYRLEAAMKVFHNSLPEHRRNTSAYNVPGMSFESRYVAVNASRNNRDTIEIRNHDATLDHKEIINWIKTLNYTINATGLDGFPDEFRFQIDRLTETFKAIKLPSRLQKYVLERISENNKEYKRRMMNSIKKKRELKLTKSLEKNVKSIQLRLGA